MKELKYNHVGQANSFVIFEKNLLNFSGIDGT